MDVSVLDAGGLTEANIRRRLGAATFVFGPKLTAAAPEVLYVRTIETSCGEIRISPLCTRLTAFLPSKYR